MSKLLKCCWNTQQHLNSLKCTSYLNILTNVTNTVKFETLDKEGGILKYYYCYQKHDRLDLSDIGW